MQIALVATFLPIWSIFTKLSLHFLRQVHVGTQNVTKQMETYIFQRNKDGLYLLDLAKTWEKAMVAARVIAAVQSQCAKDVLVSILPYKQSLSFANRFIAGLLKTRLCRMTETATQSSNFSSPSTGCIQPSICPESHSQVRH